MTWTCDAPSNNRYVRRVNPCRCDGCRDAHRIYERDRQRDIRRPDGRAADVLVDAAPVVEHIRWLQAHGYGMGTTIIARRAGLHPRHVQHLLYGIHTRIRQSTAEAILSVGRHEAKYVECSHVARHLQALQAGGWQPKMIADLTGVDRHTIQQIKDGRRKRTNPRLARYLMSFNPPPRDRAA